MGRPEHHAARCSLIQYDLLGQQIKCGQGTTTSHSVCPLFSCKKKSLYREQLPLSPLPPVIPPPLHEPKVKIGLEGRLIRIPRQGHLSRLETGVFQSGEQIQQLARFCPNMLINTVGLQVSPHYVEGRMGQSLGSHSLLLVLVIGLSQFPPLSPKS